MVTESHVKDKAKSELGIGQTGQRKHGQKSPDKSSHACLLVALSGACDGMRATLHCDHANLTGTIKRSKRPNTESGR